MTARQTMMPTIAVRKKAAIHWNATEEIPKSRNSQEPSSVPAMHSSRMTMFRPHQDCHQGQYAEVTGTNSTDVMNAALIST